tara:strand:- start:185 stop:490 length:306 start_codon:yes stop_codon:yes gene_type:complete
MTINNYNLEGDIKAKLAKLDAADDHPTVAIAERAVFAAQSFLERLMEIRQMHRTDECDDLINSTRDLLSDLVGRAVAEEENDRVNGSWNRACAAADFRRGF